MKLLGQNIYSCWLHSIWGKNILVKFTGALSFEIFSGPGEQLGTAGPGEQYFSFVQVHRFEIFSGPGEQLVTCGPGEQYFSLHRDIFND